MCVCIYIYIYKICGMDKVKHVLSPPFPRCNSEKISNLPRVTQFSMTSGWLDSRSLLLSTGPGREPPPLAWPHLHPKRETRAHGDYMPSADSLLSSSTYLPSIFLTSGDTVGIVLLKLSMRLNHLKSFHLPISPGQFFMK